MIQIVGLFLIGMVVLAVAGRMRKGPGDVPKPKKCRSCGRYLIGGDRCDCQ